MCEAIDVVMIHSLLSNLDTLIDTTCALYLTPVSNMFVGHAVGLIEPVLEGSIKIYTLV